MNSIFGNIYFALIGFDLNNNNYSYMKNHTKINASRAEREIVGGWMVLLSFKV